MIPAKLKKGDEIRVIAPVRSLSLLSDQAINSAIKALEAEGFKITFSKNAKEKDLFISSSITSRIEDLHEAFSDKNVKAILTVIGGFNSNQLLKYIDYDLIKKNSKIICGFSDVTALTNAIYAKTGVVTYSGTHFSSWAMERGFEYSKEYFNECLIQDKLFELKSSKQWSDDAWYKDQNNRDFIKNEGYVIINEGQAEGTIVGGNLCTFILLHGAEYMPSLKNSILFLEDDEMNGKYSALMFDRHLQSIIHQPGFVGVKGIVIGRFQKKSEMNIDKLRFIISTKKELDKIPIIADADFGHTTPMFTFPIGGKARMLAKGKAVKLEIVEH
ncbi:MAG: S66 family peptidase [Candidatus Nanoarchaeia archaeon]